MIGSCPDYLASDMSSSLSTAYFVEDYYGSEVTVEWSGTVTGGWYMVSGDVSVIVDAPACSSLSSVK